MSFESESNLAYTFPAEETASAETSAIPLQFDPFEEAIELQRMIIASQDLPADEKESLIETFEVGLLDLSERALEQRIRRLKVRLKSLPQQPQTKNSKQPLAKVTRRPVGREIDGVQIVKVSPPANYGSAADLLNDIEEIETTSDDFSDRAGVDDGEQKPTIDTGIDEPSMTDSISPLFGSPGFDGFSAYLFTNKPPSLSIKGSDVLGAAIFDGNLASKRLKEFGDSLESEARRELEDTVAAGLVARRTMASHHLPLVVGLSRRFAYDRDMVYRTDIRAEMVGVGNLALMQCMEGYIHAPGFHFAGFGGKSVKNAMIRQARSNRRSETGLSFPMQKALHEINAAYREAHDANAAVDRIEVGMSLGYSRERLEAILALTETRVRSINADPYSMDIAINAAVDKGAAKEFEDTENRIMLAQVWEVASELHRRQVITDNEWHVLYSRYVQGLSQSETKESLDSEYSISVQYAEQSVLEKIRKEIETPGYHDKNSSAEFRLVESGVDLLDILDIPIDKQTDILGIAASITDSMSLTEMQRQTMHAMMGTMSKRLRPFEYARIQGVTAHVVYDTRARAVRRIVDVWESMTADERGEVVAGSFKSNPSNPLTPDKILERALELKVRTRFSMKEAAALAKEGQFFSPYRVEEAFGTWRAFQDAYREIRVNGREA